MLPMRDLRYAWAVNGIGSASDNFRRVNALNHSGFGKCIFNAPTLVYSAFSKPWIKMKCFTQLIKRARNTLKCELAVSSRVPHLFRACSPTHISRFVVSIIVYAFNSCPLWPVTHIDNEVFSVHPSLANFNSPSAIIFIRRISGICASLNHRTPRVIYSRFGFAMRHMLSLGNMQIPTATRLGVFCEQCIVSSGELISAIAKANARGSTASICKYFGRAIGNNFKPFKCSSDEGYFLRHNDVCALFCLVAGGRLISDTRHANYG